MVAGEDRLLGILVLAKKQFPTKVELEWVRGFIFNPETSGE